MGQEPLRPFLKPPAAADHAHGAGSEAWLAVLARPGARRWQRRAQLEAKGSSRLRQRGLSNHHDVLCHNFSSSPSTAAGRRRTAAVQRRHARGSAWFGGGVRDLAAAARARCRKRVAGCSCCVIPSLNHAHRSLRRVLQSVQIVVRDLEGRHPNFSLVHW